MFAEYITQFNPINEIETNRILLLFKSNTFISGNINTSIIQFNNEFNSNYFQNLSHFSSWGKKLLSYIETLYGMITFNISIEWNDTFCITVVIDDCLVNKQEVMSALVVLFIGNINDYLEKAHNFNSRYRNNIYYHTHTSNTDITDIGFVFPYQLTKNKMIFSVYGLNSNLQSFPFTRFGLKIFKKIYTLQTYSFFTRIFYKFQIHPYTIYISHSEYDYNNDIIFKVGNLLASQELILLHRNDSNVYNLNRIQRRNSMSS